MESAAKLFLASGILTLIALSLLKGWSVAVERGYVTVEELPLFLSGSLVCSATAGLLVILGFRALIKSRKTE